MEVKTFSKTTIRQAERILKSFYMIGFNDSNRDAGEERFSEQMGYPRNEPHGDLSLYAKQAILALQTAREEADCHIPDEERTLELEMQKDYLERTFIKPIAERASVNIGAGAIAKPEWLTPKIQSEIATLWRTPDVDPLNPKIKAIRLIQECSGDSGYGSIVMATEIIKQHCL